MKKRSKIKSFMFTSIASPINILAVIISYLYIIHIRAMTLAEKDIQNYNL
jgi:hypothetical protein